MFVLRSLLEGCQAKGIMMCLSREVCQKGVKKGIKVKE